MILKNSLLLFFVILQTSHDGCKITANRRLKLISCFSSTVYIKGNILLDTWGKQSFHEENMGMAIFADQKYQPETIPNELSHTYTFKNAPTKVDYSFLAVWERGNSQVKTAEEFKQLVVEACQ